jgi:cation diffusion facilitator family transporter
MSSIESALRISKLALVVNLLLAVIKFVAGIFGNSYVLIADAIESLADVFSSVVVWGGVRLSVVPADARHPYGHGKAEALAAAFVSVVLLGAAVVIAIHSLGEIRAPHGPPAKFTLVVLVAVIAIKETLYRFVWKTGASLDSTALKADAWHHRSDALTSTAAFVGILVALIGGKTFESADEWAALVACSVIAWNGIRLLRGIVR